MSQALLVEGNALCLAKGQDQFLGVTWCDRGILALEDGAWATAARFFADSVAKLFGEWDTWYIARPLVGLALVAVEWGDVALAARLVGAGEAFSARVGSFPHGVAGHQVAAVTARLQQIVPADGLAALL